jgi:serine/threonine-protein kinase
LKDKGFKVTKDYEYSDTVEAGKVISQTPEADAKKTKDTRVTIVISEGANTKTVPADLIGKSESDAIKALKDLGFIANVVKQTSNGAYPAGKVFKVDGAGTQKTIGSTINVYVSNDEEPAKVKIPTNLVGMDQDEVGQALEELGFLVKVKDDKESTEPEGTVTLVEMAGVEVKEGSTVVIYVSTGEGAGAEGGDGDSENTGAGTDSNVDSETGENTTTP